MTLLKRLAAWWNPPQNAYLQPKTEPETYRQREYREASDRWRQYNAEKRAAGCPCGQPATEVEYDHRNIGSVPVETWTCTDHTGMSMWSGRGETFRPCWTQPQQCRTCPGFCASTSHRDAPEPFEWHCPRRAIEICLDEGHQRTDVTTIDTPSRQLMCARCGASWSEPWPVTLP